MKRDEKTDAEWREQLTAEQYAVCREKGTEAPFTGKYEHCTDEGTYVCVCCGQELFSADYKYDSRSGWPSFTRPVKGESVTTATDAGQGMIRTEVMCSNCDAHLGHVFDDAPLETGKRYCINSVDRVHRRGRPPRHVSERGHLPHEPGRNRRTADFGWPRSPGQWPSVGSGRPRALFQCFA